jgi:hypothetical protein
MLGLLYRLLGALFDLLSHQASFPTLSGISGHTVLIHLSSSFREF